MMQRFSAEVAGWKSLVKLLQVVTTSICSDHYGSASPAAATATTSASASVAGLDPG